MDDMSFNGRSALSYWRMELISCYITTAKKKAYMIDLPAGDGQIDALSGLPDPVFEMRTLTATFKSVERTPQDTIDRLLFELEGRQVPIIAPDNPDYYFVGTPHVQAASNAPGANITITAIVFPWRYYKQETVHNIPASASAVSCLWFNAGARSVVPELIVADANVAISIGSQIYDLPAGSYDMSEFKIPGKSSIAVTVSGGRLTAKYREAIL